MQIRIVAKGVHNIRFPIDGAIPKVRRIERRFLI